MKKHLTPEAIADGAKSGLSEKVMLALGMRSLVQKEVHAMLGFDGEAYMIPYDGAFWRVKILRRKQKFGPNNQKYSQAPGTRPGLYPPKLPSVNWSKVKKDNQISLFITEGEKKAAAACLAGIPCIGIGGVWCFRSKECGFLPEWKDFALKGRKVFIVYDSDIIDKPQVRYAEYALAIDLTALGAEVLRVRLPQSEDDRKTGLDDFLVEHGLSHSIKRAVEAFNKLHRETIDPTFPPHLTDTGNAIRFEQEFNDRLRYVPLWKRWICFDKTSGLWHEDDDGEIMRCAKMLAYALRKEADKIKDETVKKAFLSWAKKSESEQRLKATLNLAASESGLIVSHDQLDANSWELAFRNGKTINLKTGVVRETLPEDFFTKSIGIDYEPSAKCPRWDQFLHEILRGDLSLISFFQRFIGYCLTGGMTEQCFLILFGFGANGKTTLLNILLELFGAYGRQASPHTFMMQKHEGGPRSDIVRLMGVRFIATSETEDNQRLAESFIKQWTGGEQISARDLYGKVFEFSPQGKILLATNHKPKIHGADNAIWRRIILIPFARTFSDKEKDPQLLEKLREELPGILNWALLGCKEWQRSGLRPPESVRMAVGVYRADMDVIGSWLEERCETGKEHAELIDDLFRNHKAWADEGSEYLVSKARFVRAMEERSFEKQQTTRTVNKVKKKGRFLLGVRLIPKIYEAK